MSFALCYWILILLLVVGWGWASWPLSGRTAGVGLILFILLVLLGWKVFGAPLHS